MILREQEGKKKIFFCLTYQYHYHNFVFEKAYLMKSIHLLSFIIVTALFSSLYLFSQSAGKENYLRLGATKSNAEPSLKFIAMGDYGWNNTVRKFYIIISLSDSLASY